MGDTPADWLIVGLGNPGKDYEHTRHNAGADAVSVLAARHGAKLKAANKEKATVDVARLGAARVVLAVPMTYMNDSGIAVSLLAKRHNVDDVTRIVIVHDELDLEVGRLKLKEGGGLAGNNGLKSVKAHLHTDAFLRVRIGIGKPPGKAQGADHVLKKPGKAEREALLVSIEEAADAVELIVAQGMAAAMNAVNARV
ncbi:MAG: aminoacyl-tRNA hydrolase [Acidimicrobiales bacterium]|nr:aminoacyl-tRNA hydrolase [Acidimicrobiales bacterium]